MSQGINMDSHNSKQERKSLIELPMTHLNNSARWNSKGGKFTYLVNYRVCSFSQLEDAITSFGRLSTLQQRVWIS
jgi:hypothetical protein